MNEAGEELRAMLEDIIKSSDIRSVFQPIVSLRDGSVLGYEALSRGPKGTELENPERLFAVAEEYAILQHVSIMSFYREDDVNKGYIIAKNRQGFEEQYPLISLSIAGVAACSRRFCNVFELSAEASRIKKECKMILGSAYIIV